MFRNMPYFDWQLVRSGPPVHIFFNFRPFGWLQIVTGDQKWCFLIKVIFHRHNYDVLTSFSRIFGECMQILTRYIIVYALHKWCTHYISYIDREGVHINSQIRLYFTPATLYIDNDHSGKRIAKCFCMMQPQKCTLAFYICKTIKNG